MSYSYFPPYTKHSFYCNCCSFTCYTLGFYINNNTNLVYCSECFSLCNIDKNHCIISEYFEKLNSSKSLKIPSNYIFFYLE